MTAVATRKKGSSQADQLSYDDLYRRWEEGNWKASEIDFTEDLSPYIDAAPKEEQKYFLATQQVDEARHSFFFHRFFKEVIGAGGTIGSTLAYTEPQLGWGYRNVFDRLDRIGEELRRDRSLPKFAQAIALYHMVVEATLAQPGQHFIEDYFTKAGTMPGFSEGMHHVSRDEQRHIGFGVKTLSECFRETDECKAAVAEILREVMRYSMAVFVPPGWDLSYTRCYGFELEDIYAFGMRSVEAKWKAAGYPIDEMPPDVYPFDLQLPHEERARRAIALMRAGVAGEPVPDPDSSPEVQRLYFDLIARSAHADALNGRPVTIQWRFEDAAPWYLRIAGGTSEAVQGTATDADLTLETTWRHWIDMSMRGGDPRRAMLQRKLRPHGSLRMLWRMQQIFPRAGRR
jgi:hypothetical protein